MKIVLIKRYMTSIQKANNRLASSCEMYTKLCFKAPY